MALDLWVAPQDFAVETAGRWRCRAVELHLASSTVGQMMIAETTFHVSYCKHHKHHAIIVFLQCDSINAAKHSPAWAADPTCRVINYILIR